MASQTNSIRYLLERIRAAVLQRRLTQSTATKTKNMSDPREREFWDELALYEQDLRRFLRLLTGRQIALENERPLLWRIPREHRFSARQSLDDRERVNLDLVELAELTLKDLLAFYGDAATMKPADWQDLGQKAIELADKIDHALVHTAVQQVQKGPAFTGTALPGFGLEHLAPLIGLLIAYISSRRSRGRRSAG